MARIRTIKPEFWSNEKIMGSSRNSRLLFIGLWNFADDAGRMIDSAKTIKAQVYPGDDDICSTMVRGMLDELSEIGLLQKYEVDGRAYLQITGWDHQRIDKPRASKIPPPNSTNDRRSVAPDLTLSNPTVSNLSRPLSSLASAPSALAHSAGQAPVEKPQEVWRGKPPHMLKGPELHAAILGKGTKQ